MGIWQHIHTVTSTDDSPDLGEFAEIIDDVNMKVRESSPTEIEVVVPIAVNVTERLPVPFK